MNMNCRRHKVLSAAGILLLVLAILAVNTVTVLRLVRAGNSPEPTEKESEEDTTVLPEEREPQNAGTFPLPDRIYLRKGECWLAFSESDPAYSELTHLVLKRVDGGLVRCAGVTESPGAERFLLEYTYANPAAVSYGDGASEDTLSVVTVRFPLGGDLARYAFAQLQTGDTATLGDLSDPDAVNSYADSLWKEAFGNAAD